MFHRLFRKRKPDMDDAAQQLWKRTRYVATLDFTHSPTRRAYWHRNPDAGFWSPDDLTNGDVLESEIHSTTTRVYWTVSNVTEHGFDIQAHHNLADALVKSDEIMDLLQTDEDDDH